MLIPTLLISFLYRSNITAESEVEKLVVEVGDSVLNLLVWWIYYAVLHSSIWQASIGKKLLGMKVVNYAGKRISFGRATGRHFASLLSALFLFIGFVMVGLTRRKQGLHDFMTRTLVVRVDDIYQGAEKV
jgi:uncharacterized RDD family membrane protein YckC